MNKFIKYSYSITTDDWGNGMLAIPISDFSARSDLILNITCGDAYFVLYYLVPYTNSINIRLINNDQNRTNAINITRDIWIVVKKY